MVVQHEGAKAQLTDKFGDKRVVRKTRRGWQLKRDQRTPAIAMSKPLAEVIGKRIREHRIAQGLTLEELALRCGMTADPKNRMWTIENATRGHGVRIGTLYAIALVLNIELSVLMPTLEEARILFEQEGLSVAELTMLTA